MAIVYLGLGTNLGDKTANLHTAVHQIEEKIGNVVSLSSIYETAPRGFDSENSFLNAAVGVETTLSPQEVLHRTQEIERSMGRTQKSEQGVYHDRVIDIDLLLYNKVVMHTSELVLPHPLMLQREFVMKPLVEIAPDVVHPVLGKKLGEIDVRVCLNLQW